MQQDWLKLHRKIVRSAVFADPELFKLWVLCLVKANWKDCTVFWEGLKTPIHLKRGQFVTGRQSLHADFYPKWRVQRKSARTVWRWLHALQDLDNLRIESVQAYSVVTICHYDTYQDVLADSVQGSVQPVSNPCPTRVQPIGTGVSTEEEKKEAQEGKEQKEETSSAPNGTGVDDSSKPKTKPPYAAAFETFYQRYPRKKDKRRAYSPWQRACKMVSLRDGISIPAAEEYIQEAVESFAVSRLGAAGEFCPYAANWLDRQSYDDDRAEWDRHRPGDSDTPLLEGIPEGYIFGDINKQREADRLAAEEKAADDASP